MFKRLKLTRSRLSKSEFCDLICSDDVWGKAFSVDNITNGFARCGIVPLDRNAYPTYRFNANLKHRYDLWVQSGKPELSASELDEILDRKLDDVTELSTQNLVNMSSYQGRAGRFVTYFISDDEPDNLIRLPSSAVDTSCSSIDTSNRSSNANTPSVSESTILSPSSSTPKQPLTSLKASATSAGFKEVLLKRLDSIQTPKVTPQAAARRRKVNPYGELVTSDVQFEAAVAAAEGKVKPKKKKKAKERRN